VPAVRPLRFAEIASELVPDPALTADVFDPYDVVVPYSTYQVVDCPPGLTLPVTVAVVDPTAVVGPVLTVGAANAAPGAIATTVRTISEIAHKRGVPIFVARALLTITNDLKRSCRICRYGVRRA
jgi:hypothetical protein